MSVKVKICGIKRLEDIEYVNEYLPDYVGFVFSKSKRQVTLNQAKVLVNNLNNRIKKVGVFVNETLEYVSDISKALKLDVIQFHGEENDLYMKQFNDFVVWKALKIKDEINTINLNFKYVDGIVLDSQFGGSGRSFNWTNVRNIKFYKDVILAGGLNSENIETAISEVQPDIVDVSSGVESFGFKDSDKIKNFILKVRKIK